MVGRTARRLLLTAVSVLLLAAATPAGAGAVPFSNVLALDGSDDYAKVNDNTSLDLGDAEGEDFTLESFIYVPNTSSEASQVIFWKQYAYALTINFHSGGTADLVSFRLWPSVLEYLHLDSLTNISAGWHHIAAVYEGNPSPANDAASIYLDGSRIAYNNAAFSFTPGIMNSTNVLSVGANSGVASFDGRFDEARISDSVRYSGGSYTVPSAPFTSDGSTRALWRFNEPWGSTSFADSSSNGNTLAGYNGAHTEGVPDAPTITGTVPASPANANSPAVRGTLGGGAPTQVKVYKNPSCEGSPDATGSAEEFTGPGIHVAVGDDTRTGLSARATNGVGDSSCSNSVAYREDSTPPPAPVVTATAPEGPANDNEPRVRGLADNLDLALLPGNSSAATLSGNGDGTFSAPSETFIGPIPQAVAVGDLNGDESNDLVVADSGANRVSILLNEGAGAFGAPTTIGVGGEPYAVAIGDFNRDGSADLATANYSTSNVSILLGRGDGTFTGPTNFSAGGAPRAIAIGDFDGDSNPDLAVANFWANTISILTGSGTGSFSAPVAHSAGAGPTAIALADFNGDGDPDLAVADDASNEVSILLGESGTGFGGPMGVGVGSRPRSITAADLNRDGDPDLAVANWNAGNIAVLLGASGATFSPPVTYPVEENPRSIAEGDFNGDGRLDLAVANESSGSISVLAGAGDGTLGAASKVETGHYPFALATADFDSDAATIWLNADEPACSAGPEAENSRAAFEGAGIPIPVGGDHASQLRARAVDAAGNVSSCSAPFEYVEDSTEPETTIESGPAGPTKDSTPTFEFSSNEPGSAFECRVDSNPFAGCESPHTTASLADGAHTFEVRAVDEAGNVDSTPASRGFSVDTVPPETVIYSGPSGRTDKTVATFTFGATGGGPGTTLECRLDAEPFAACPGGFTSGTLEDGSHTFEARATDAVGNRDESPATRSFVVDTSPPVPETPRIESTEPASPSSQAEIKVKGTAAADPDIAVALREETHLAVLLGTAAGTFAGALEPETGNRPAGVASGDFDQDGNADLVAVGSSGDVAILLGNGDGTFSAPAHYSAGEWPFRVEVGDLNEDGDPDLAVLNNSSKDFSILLGGPGGTFGAPTSYGLGGYGRGIAIGDYFDADFNPDIAVAVGSSVKVLYGLGNGTFYDGGTFPVGSEASSLATADFNGDGFADLAVSSYYGNSVTILRGTDGGTFAPPSPSDVYAVGAGAEGIAIGDFNGDSDPDVAVAASGIDEVAVLLGTAGVSFTGPTRYPVGDRPTAIAATDFNNDGDADLATANMSSDDVTVLLGGAGGTFGSPTTFSAGDSPTDIAVAELDQNAIETVRVYSSADCSGAPLGEGSVSQFAGAGISATVPANQTTHLRAKSIDAEGRSSGCSDAFDYVEDSTPPATPTIAGTEPASPSNENNPRVKGTAESGSTVRIYPGTGSLCFNAPIGEGSASQFEGEGIAISVASDQSTYLRAKAFDAAGNASGCSAGIYYVEDSTGPTNPTLASPSHTVEVPSRFRNVEVSWSGATDAGSGIDGYSYEWSNSPETVPDTVKDAEEGTSAATSPALADGSHYFHLRTRDEAGNWSDAVHIGPFVIDGTAPEVAEVTSSSPNGLYRAGSGVLVRVVFDSPVSVTGGTPQLTLETGKSDAQVDYGSGSGTDTLTFPFIVGAGQVASDLDYTGTGALTLNGAAIRDAAGNDAVLTLPAPGFPGSLGANKDIGIDGVVPTNPSLASPSHTVGIPSKNRTIHVTWSGASDVESGVDGYSYEWSSSPGTVPDTTKDAEEGAADAYSPVLPEGNAYFHLRTQDNAGNWSEAVHLGPFPIDFTAPGAPSIAGTTPAPPANNNIPKVRGSAESGSTVRIYPTGDCSGSPIGEGSAAQFGGEGIAVTVPSDQTTHLRATATDAAGNASGCSAAFDYVEDSTPPAPPTISGTVPASPANENHLKVRGSAESGSTVRIYSTAGCTGTLAEGPAEQLGGDGIAVTVPSDQTTHLSARAIDAAGNASGCSGAFDYVEDSTPPAAPTINATVPAPPANDTHPKVRGSAEDGSTVRIYSTADCSGTPIGEGPAAQLGGEGIEVTVPSDQTTHLRATASDAAGNPSACSSAFDYVEDSSAPAAPTISATVPAPPSPNNVPKVIGSAEAGATVRIYSTADCSGSPLGEGPAAQLGGEGIEVTVPSDQTTHLRATATDAAGNTSGCSAAFDYVEDSTPPTVAITATDPASPANENHPKVRGSAEDGSTVRVYLGSCEEGSIIGEGSAAQLAGAGISVTVPDDQYSYLRARAVDAAGNWSSCEASFGYSEDSTSPATPTITAAIPASPANENHPKVRGSGAEWGGTVRIYDGACGGDLVGEGTATQFNGTGITITVPDDGTVNLRAQAVDAAGNPSGCSDALAYTEDSKPPAAPTILGTHPASPGMSSNPGVYGSAESEATVRIYSTGDCSGQALGEGSALEFGSGISAAVPSDQTTHLRATATDRAGNTSTCSGPVDYLQDSIAPSNPSLSSPSHTVGVASNDRTVEITLSGASDSGSGVDGYSYVWNLSSTTTPDTSKDAEESVGSVTSEPLPEGGVYFHLRTVDNAGRWSEPVHIGPFQIDFTPPATPSIQATVPTSPSNDNNPLVRGSADSDATVQVYSTSDCTGTPLGEGTAAQFSGAGISVTVPSDQTTHLRVTATDAAGNHSPCSSPSREYTEDSTPPPVPSIAASVPASPSNDNSPRVRGSYGEPDATIRVYSTADCSGGQLGEGTGDQFAGEGISVTVPSDQTTRLRVRASDVAGNLSTCWSGFDYTEDSTAPDTRIESGPSGLIARRQATFEFTASEPGARFECRLDSGWADCGTPRVYENVAEGPHVFEVRAVDAAGNTDFTPAERSFRVDTTPPETTISSGPSGSIDSREATFAFSSSEAGSAFECALDGATFSSCVSPTSFSGLGPGAHRFAVRALDAAGNVDASPAVREFSVSFQPAADTTPPAFTLRGAKSQNVFKQKKVIVKASCSNEPCTVTVSGKFTNGPKIKLKPISRSVSAGGTVTIKLKVSSKNRERLADAMAKGKKPKAKITGSASDAAGNQAHAKLAIRLKGAPPSRRPARKASGAGSGVLNQLEALLSILPGF